MLDKVINNSEFCLEDIVMDNPRIRIGARGIIVGDDGLIGVFNKQNKNEYKLPGGGVDEGESLEDAFIREVLEETGYLVEINKKLGIITENRSSDNFKQISHVYVANLIKNTGNLNLTEKEIDEGGVFIWMDPKDAYEKIKNCINDLIESKYENIYHSKFIVTRDKYILEYYLEGFKNE